VSELTAQIASTLKGQLGTVWVGGELSSFKRAASGHRFFALKDETAQLDAVMFKRAADALPFEPMDGMDVVVQGRVDLWRERGRLQLYVEHMEPLGLGALRLAFEQLKARLAAEGLFDDARKRPLPTHPHTIGIVTARQGAAIHDMLRILRDRWPAARVLLRPVRVQGAGAARDIADGIADLAVRHDVDVLIVGRGGGSLEDLWAFNEEPVARAIAASRVPVVSAVGHEIDFTIADFVADVRAATPSAAAEMVVQAKEELRARLAHLDSRAQAASRLRLTRVRSRLEAVTAHRVFEAERGRLRTGAQRTDELQRRCLAALARRRERARDEVRRVAERLSAFRFERQVHERRQRLQLRDERLGAAWRGALESRRAGLGRAAGKLDALSPLAVLSRGFAVVFDASGERVLRRARDAAPGDALRIRLQEGALRASVTRREGE
jgi:exodeoxyribonuclease VII large subunit